jgi:hypothetical protein
MVNTFTSTILITLNKGRIIRSLTSVIAAMTLMMLFSVSAFAAQINVAVDRNPIAMTDSFQLTFSTSTSPDDDPNFTPLQTDFDIINQQKSSQLSWVNGTSNRSIQWTLNVMAKRSGELQIPAISFGKDTSQPLSITVTKTTPSNAVSNNDELFLEVEATPTENYVQAQILYTVRFYHRIDLAQATLTDPELDNAVVEKIAEDTQYNTQIKGMIYRVTERKYAIFPQNSGAMTIAPLVLTAEAIINSPQSQFNGFFTQHSTQTKRVLSKEINLDIKPAPASLKGQQWLPAEQVTLKETWSNKTLQVKVGEPITRTLTMSAKGATSSQLPDLSTQALNPELKTYPDQPVINDQQNGEGVMAMREQKIALIPSTAGDFTLPAIEVPWFNTQTQKMEIAQLPAVTLVAVAAATSNSPTINNNNSPTAPANSPQKDTAITPASTSDKTWMWVSIAFGLAWLITLLALFWSRFAKPRTKQVKQKATAKNTPLTLKEVTKELKTACANNDPQAAQQALIKWATLRYNITNLAELSLYCDADMQAELTKLNLALYAKEKLAWHGADLLKAVMVNQTQKSSAKKADEPLVPLYPSQR